MATSPALATHGCIQNPCSGESTKQVKPVRWPEPNTEDICAPRDSTRFAATHSKSPVSMSRLQADVRHQNLDDQCSFQSEPAMSQVSPSMGPQSPPIQDYLRTGMRAAGASEPEGGTGGRRSVSERRALPRRRVGRGAPGAGRFERAGARGLLRRLREGASGESRGIYSVRAIVANCNRLVPFVSDGPLLPSLPTLQITSLDELFLPCCFFTGPPLVSLRHCLCLTSPPQTFNTSNGAARRGTARHGTARYGMVRRGTALHCTAPN